MKTRIYLLFFLFILSTHLSAQKYKKNESLNVRTDPEWYKTNQLSGFSMPDELKVDKYGNVYSTGYFRRDMWIDGKWLAIKCNPTLKTRCQEVSFLMKRDHNGKILWVRFAKGSARINNFQIDDNGNITVVGLSWGSLLELTSINDEVIAHSSGTHSIFMCEYDKDGRILRSKVYSKKRKEAASDIIIDRSGNVYIGGRLQVYDKHRKSFSNYLLLKFNKNWELEWEMKNAIDTLGGSSINGMYLDKNGDLLITGFYQNHIDFNGKIWSSEDYHQIPYIARLNKDGQLKWFNDKISQHGNGVGWKVVTDKRGDAYVIVNTSYSFAFFSKVKNNGKLDWQHKMDGSCTFYDIKIDRQNNIYLCGIGNGAIFPSIASEAYSFKTKGGTDIFYAQYSSKGQLKWMKAAGSKSTDYCTGIALDNQYLYAFGMVDGPLTFRKTTTDAKRKNFWLAKFQLNQLAKIDNTPPLPPPPPPKTINSVTCECTHETHKPRFVPPIDELASFEDFSALAKGWKPARIDNFYESMYYRELQFQTSRAGGFYSMTALCARQMELMHPDETFIINLTPCTSENKHREIPLTVNYQVQARNYTGYDYKEFDKTAKSYLDVFTSILSINGDILLHTALFKEKMLSIDEFSRQGLYKYGLNLPIEVADEKTYTSQILLILDKNDIDFYEFMAQIFVVTSPGEHPITYDEARRIERLVERRYPFEKLQKFLYPEVDVSFNIKYFGVEINPEMLRKWDVKQNRPVVENGLIVPFKLVATVPYLQYSTERNFTANIRAICSPWAEITNTGILIYLQNTYMISRPKAYNNFRRYQKDRAFANPNIKETQQYIGERDTLFSTFTGLDVGRSSILFSFKNDLIGAQGRRFLINNKMIYGEMVLHVNHINDREFSIIGTNGDVITSLDELNFFFEGKAFDYLRLEKKGNEVWIKFRKVSF